LAGSIGEPRTSAELLRLAEEYEARIAHLQGADPNAPV
jgi:hypothetical protein